MKPVEMLNQVKELLGIEAELSEDIKLAQMKLENGTVLEAEKFENEQPVFIVTEDEKVALPLGEYKLEDGKVLIVEEEGVIKEIVDEVKKEEEEDEKEEVEASEEISEDNVETETELEDEKEEMKYVTKQELNAAVDEIKAMIDELKYDKKEDMSSDVAEELGLAMTEMLSKEEPVELSEETEKVNHSPEGKESKPLNLYAKKRTSTTKDRVLNRILNIK
jgi:hypothetical protein